jgi:hypothetical protein
MIFIDGKYQESITVDYKPESLTKEGDPLGLNKARLINRMKQADLDNLAYEKSKARLYGIISSMTTKEVDKKLSVQRSLIKGDTTLPNSSSCRPVPYGHSTFTVRYVCFRTSPANA